MKKILFLIHDLGQGGAEKVLVNLVNNMDRTQFDISVTALFGGGVNEQFLAPDIHYRAVFKKEFPGNSHVMKLFSPKMLHKLCVKERYDIEVSYLEGPSARVVSGCTDESTKLVSWIHSTMSTSKEVAASFRNADEAMACYGRMDRLVFVSKGVQESFLGALAYGGTPLVLYNTVPSEAIRKQAKEIAEEIDTDNVFRMIAVGTLKEVKGYDRLLRIVKRLRYENYPVRLYILGVGPLQEEFEQYIAESGLENDVVFLGYQTNPYKYVAKCDLFVCASHAEGFSTAATEALIVGTPVCTVEVSGMKELLGENNEYGVVTENDEEALYEGIKRFFEDPTLLPYYKEQALKRGKAFSTKKTVRAVEKMLLGL